MPDLLYLQSSACSPMQGIAWRRPTHVYCSQEDTPLAGTGLASLVGKASLTPETTGMIGIVASTPTLARVEQILSDPASANKVIFLAVVDGCPASHVLADFAFRALSRQAMMVIATHGNACMDPIWKEATSRATLVHRIPPAPPGVQPTYLEQRGNLLRMTFPRSVSSADITRGILESYATPFLADREAPRGIVAASVKNWAAGAAGICVGAIATGWLWKRIGKKGCVVGK